MGKYSDRYREDLTKESISAEHQAINAEIEAAQTKEREYALSEALTKGAKEFPASAYRQVKSVYDAVRHPVKTWEGLKAVSKDIYKQSIETALEDMGFNVEEIKFQKGHILEEIQDRPALDLVIDDLEKTYGTYEGFKKTVAEDPARVAVDIGTILAPAAKSIEATATMGKLPGVAALAEKTGKAAAMLEPITAATALTKKGIGVTSKLTGKAFESLTPSGLYKSATKMSTTLTDKERNRLAQIALEQEIPPTFKGLDKIDAKISEIDNTISNMIDEADRTGEVMPVAELFKSFGALKKERMLSSKPTEGIKAIDSIKKSILDANQMIKRDALTPTQVQKLKQTIYKDLKNYYENMSNSQASVKAQKAVARSAKEYLEELLPEIKNLNKNDSDLIALREALDRPVSRIENRDIIGLGAMSKMGGGALTGSVIGGAEGGAAAAVAGLALGVLDDPVVKSKLAIVLNKLQKKGFDIRTDRAIMRLMAEETARTIKEE